MIFVRANREAALRTAEMSANESVCMEDWVQYLKSNEGKLGDELELSQLQPGDLLRIVTLHSEYFLTIVKGREAMTNITLRSARRSRTNARGMQSTAGTNSGESPTRYAQRQPAKFASRTAYVDVSRPRCVSRTRRELPEPRELPVEPKLAAQERTRSGVMACRREHPQN